MAEHEATRKHRSKCRTFADIIRAVQGSERAKVTYLIHAANLPYGRLMEYLAIMESSGLIEAVISEDETYYVVTAKGRRYLQEFKKFEEFGDLFGVEI